MIKTAWELPIVDFEAELEKLLAGEQEPLPLFELAEVLAENRAVLEAVNKRQADVSLQVEEIYDLVKDADTRELQGVLNTERSRAQQLLGAAVGLSDLLEYFCVYAGQSGSAELEHQGRLLWQNSRRILEGCGITRLGEAGQPLDPALHTVQSVAASEFPRETVAQVLQSGYRYLGRVARKAVVVLSTGASPAATETETDTETEMEGVIVEDINTETEMEDTEYEQNCWD
jgi:molecular chaperone GrpE (heat shock protein)